MKLSTSGLGQQSNEGGEKECLNKELWHACAGPLVSLPTVGSRVVYFPQGHIEQVAATTNKEADGHIPNYPSLSPQLICQLHNVTMHADTETDEVYAQMTFTAFDSEPKDTFLPMELGMPSNQPTNYFCKTLTASDTSTHGGFSVPRRAAEKVFPPLDFSQQPPAQELIARDLHNVEWKFRHIFRGQPKRHLLTTGWSVFVSAKRLVAGDSVLFIWNEKNQLLLGIRRATQLQTVMPSSVLSSDSLHIGLLAAAAHAAATNSCFTISYNPRASPSEFVIPLFKYVKAVFHTCVSIGMRFRMLFETEESSVRRYMGTITGINDLDPVHWPNSHWRSFKVGWDESTTGERQPRVSLWEIEPLTSFPMYPSLFPSRLKQPWNPGPSSFLDHRDYVSNGFMWLGSGTGEQDLHSLNFQAVNGFPRTQQRSDTAVLGNGQNQQYQAMLTAGPQNPGSRDLLGKQFIQFQQPFPSLQPSCSYNPMLQLQQQQQQQAIQPQIPPNMLQEQNQTPTESLAQHFLQQRLNNQPEDHTQQQQNMYHESNLSQMQRHESNVPSPSLPNTEHTNSGTEFSSSTASIQKMMGSSYAGGGDNLLDLTKTVRSSLTEQLSQQSWIKYAHSQVNGFTGSMAPLRTYPEKDPAMEQQNSSSDAQNSSILGVNIDSSGLLLPITMHRFPDSSIDAAASPMEVENSGFQNSMHDCAQDSESLPSEGQLDTLNSSRTFVKVYKSGSVGCSLDISRFSSYNELQEELDQMIAIEGKLKNPHRSGWQLVFVNRENDVLLPGDDPWESFVNNVWYIKILSPEEVQQMGGQGVESLNPICQRMSSCGDLGLASGLRRNRK